MRCCLGFFSFSFFPCLRGFGRMGLGNGVKAGPHEHTSPGREWDAFERDSAGRRRGYMIYWMGLI